MSLRNGLTMLGVAILLAGCRAESDSGAGSTGAHGPTVVVDDQNFADVVLNSDQPVLVDFWATWCGPCKIIAPMVSELAADYEGRSLVAKLDVDTAPKTASEYNVQSIPTLIVFRDGQEFSRVVGTTTKSDLASRLDAALR